MVSEGGEWIMKGLEWDNPYRIRSWRELINWIYQVGFASSIVLLIVILENVGYLGYESPSQLYQDRIILITDMVGKGCLLYAQNIKLLFF